MVFDDDRLTAGLIHSGDGHLKRDRQAEAAASIRCHASRGDHGDIGILDFAFLVRVTWVTALPCLAL